MTWLKGTEMLLALSFLESVESLYSSFGVCPPCAASEAAPERSAFELQPSTHRKQASAADAMKSFMCRCPRGRALVRRRKSLAAGEPHGPRNDRRAPPPCQFFLSEAEGLALVAALAVGEVVAAEGAPVVVAGHAGPRARRAEVLSGLRRGDLSALAGAGAHLVAVVAAHALPRAVCEVAEADRVGARGRGRAAVAALRVAGRAGADLARRAARLRRVAAVAVVVRGCARGDV